MPHPDHAWDDLLDDLAGRPHFPYTADESLTKTEPTEKQKQTYERLKRWTGQDFGYDEASWRAWMIDNPQWGGELEYDPRFDLGLILGVTEDRRKQ